VVFRYQPNWLSVFNPEEAPLFIHFLINIGKSAELTYTQPDPSGSNFTVKGTLTKCPELLTTTDDLRRLLSQSETYSPASLVNKVL
jgi:hypothetical protein